MEYVIINGELYHHGVKGQKWGRRRYQNPDGSLTPEGKKRVSNKQVRKEKKQVYDEEYKKYTAKYGADKLRDDAYKLAEKYGLDMDDGGGGDPKAGAKYMKMWDRIEDIESRAAQSARAKAENYVLKTYGEKRVKSLKRGDNAIIALGIAASPILLATLPIAIPAMAISGSIKAKKAQKEAPKEAQKETRIRGI